MIVRGELLVPLGKMCYLILRPWPCHAFISPHCSNYSTSFVQIIQLQPTIPHGLLGRINLSKWSSSVNVFCVSNFIQRRCHGYGTYERTNGGTWKDRACDPCLAISMNCDWHEWLWCNNKLWPWPNYLCCTLLWGLGSLQSQLGKVFSHSQRCRMHSYTLGLVFQHTWK